MIDEDKRITSRSTYHVPRPILLQPSPIPNSLYAVQVEDFDNHTMLDEFVDERYVCVHLLLKQQKMDQKTYPVLFEGLTKMRKNGLWLGV